MNGILVESLSRHPYLCVELPSNLNWSHDIDNVIGKANRSLLVLSGIIILHVLKALKVKTTYLLLDPVLSTLDVCGTLIPRSIVNPLNSLTDW